MTGPCVSVIFPKKIFVTIRDAIRRHSCCPIPAASMATTAAKSTNKHPIADVQTSIVRRPYDPFLYGIHLRYILYPDQSSWNAHLISEANIRRIPILKSVCISSFCHRLNQYTNLISSNVPLIYSRPKSTLTFCPE